MLVGSLDCLDVQEGEQSEKEFRDRVYSAGDKDKGRLKTLLNFGRKPKRESPETDSSSDSIRNSTMTAGSSLLKNFSWPLKTKKRHRSGSGGSKEFDRKKTLSVNQQRKISARKTSSVESCSSSSLEIVAPSTSDVEFKYSWPIDGFIQQVKLCQTDGMDSKNFEINVNGVLTTWNLSVRFWVGEQGERLVNPFVLCLNLVGCRTETKKDVAVKYRFGIYNRSSEEFEMGGPEKVNLKLETKDKLQSIGYRNIAMSEKHCNSSGDVVLLVRLSIIKKEEPSHSLSSDLGSLINHEASSDLILEAGERKFRVHGNILAARSPVFAALLGQGKEDKIEEKKSLLGQSKEDKTEGKEEDKSEKVIDIQPSFDSTLKDSLTNSRCGSLNIIEPDSEGGVKKLVISDLPGDTVEELLKYIYTDNSTNVEIFSQTLLAASDRYQLPGLKLQCETHLGETINPLNVAEILLLSDSYSCTNLKKAALTYCTENHSYIMKDPSWKIIEEENPDLFEEAISEIAPETCNSHTDCIKRGGNRYETERECCRVENSKKKNNLLKKYQ